jgi:hypothetical protein
VESQTYFAPEGSIDAVFLQVNNEVAGFAGVVREEGVRVLLLTDGGRFYEARSALASRLPGRQFESATVWRPVDYEWRELASWHAAVIPLLALDEVLSTDANERLNRLVVGVRAASDMLVVREAAARRGIPAAALVLRVATRPVQLVDLEDRVRPTVGGLRINDGGAGDCTMGFNVTYGGVRRFMTNSHCTADYGEVDGRAFYQDDHGVSGDSVGVESVDPPLMDFGTFCPTGREDCRWSDAAMVSYASGVTRRKGGIAKTTASHRWNGSSTIAGNFTISGKYNPPSVGDTLHKMGATTGWTYGDVDETCENWDVSPGNVFFLMCQDFVNAGAWHGDSGSPVFQLLANDTVKLAGILWGGDPPDTVSNGRFIFSRIGNVEEDFGTALDVVGGAPLSVYIVGNSEVPPETSCTWQAFASGGQGPYSYSWSGVLWGSGTGTGLGNFITGEVSASGYLYVSVSSSDGQLANAEGFWVTVDEQVEECPE